MRSFVCRFVFSCLAAVGGINGFSIPTSCSSVKRITSTKHQQRSRTTTTTTTTTTTVLASSIGSSIHHQDEETYRYILNKAREYAFSDDDSSTTTSKKNMNTSVEEGKAFLTAILELESGCISGMIAGNDLCNNVDEMAEIVAQLRHKITIHQEQLHKQTGIMTTTGIIPMRGSSMIGVLAIISAIAVLMSIGLVPNQWNVAGDVQPFTLQEWKYAYEDGYLDIMMQHYLRNGGL